jgi:Transposase DDE domain group 1
VLLQAAEQRYGLIASMAGCLRDPRQASKVSHSLHDLFAQPAFSIGCGYADANDWTRLAADPMRKMLLDREPVTGSIWPRSRGCRALKMPPGPRQLYNMGAALAESVIERHVTRLHHRARLVTIDLNPTDDPTHGAHLA